MKTQALEDLRKENKETIKKTRAATGVGLLHYRIRGPREDKDLPKIFQHHRCCSHHRGEAVGWVCWKYNCRRRGGLWVWADTSPYQSGHVSVSLGARAPLLPQGTGSLGRGPRECTHLHPEGGDGPRQQADFQAGQKREGTPYSKSLPTSLNETPFSSFRLPASFR